jgi:histone-lysine N-methyltransferase SETMAR
VRSSYVMRSFKKNGNIVYNSQNETASDNLILEQYLEQRQTLNSDVLRNQLESAIRRKRRGLLSSGVWRQCANARPLTTLHTVQRIQDLNWRCYPQTPYSLDLALSDFHLFWPLKDALRGRHFRSGEEVKEAAYDWLAQQPKDFYPRGFIS